MLFMNEGALRDLLDDKLEFTGDLSFASGPIGRTVDAGILIYSSSSGASIGGAVLTADNSINKPYLQNENRRGFRKTSWCEHYEFIG